MVLKVGTLASSVAETLSDSTDDTSLSFEGTNNEDAAIEAVTSGRAMLIVSGILGIEWRKVQASVGSERLIVFSALNDSRTISVVEKAGLEFVEIDKNGIDKLVEAINRRLPRQ